MMQVHTDFLFVANINIISVRMRVIWLIVYGGNLYLAANKEKGHYHVFLAPSIASNLQLMSLFFVWHNHTS